jgi:hypothetical protein
MTGAPAIIALSSDSHAARIPLPMKGTRPDLRNRDGIGMDRVLTQPQRAATTEDHHDTRHRTASIQDDDLRHGHGPPDPEARTARQ